MATRRDEERLEPLLLTPTPSDTAINGHADWSSTSSTPAAAHTRPTLPALTGLRAALMMHVLIRNMRLVTLVEGVDILGWMVDAGAVGVSTFFCLSGFILAYCYGDHCLNTWRCYFSFIGRRYARLLPIYWISQLMCVGQQVNEVRQYGWDVWTVLHWIALATGTNLWFPWPLYDRSSLPFFRGTIMLNPTLWALSAVLFFYVSMPLLMRLIRWFCGVDRLSELPRGSSTSRLLVLWVLFSALIWVPIVATLDSAAGNPLPLYMPYGRVAEFTLGVVAAALYLSIRQRQQQLQQQHDIESAVSAQQGESSALIDYLASTPLLNSPIVLDIVTALTITLVILLGLPSVDRPEFLDTGTWLATVLCYIILMLALTSSPSSSNTGKQSRRGMFSWLLTRPVALDLGAMSFCFYAFHYVPITYAESIGLPPNRSAAIEFCAGVGLAWLGYKYVETPVYHMLSARLPSCRCHKE